VKRDDKNEKSNGGGRPRRTPRRPRPELGCLEFLTLLKSGQIKGKCIHRSDRLRLVEYLYGEPAADVADIAKLFQRNEQTIRRDLERIRKANAMKADLGFADEIAGEIWGMARSVVQHLRRVGRDKATPPAVRVKAERGLLRAYIDAAQLLQSLGHLPSAALRIKMEPNGAAERPTSIRDLLPELDRLAQIATKESPGALPLLNSLRDAARTGLPPVQPPQPKAGADPAATPIPPIPPSPPARSAEQTQ
jgi:hypothetical protein